MRLFHPGASCHYMQPPLLLPSLSSIPPPSQMPQCLGPKGEGVDESKWGNGGAKGAGLGWRGSRGRGGEWKVLSGQGEGGGPKKWEGEDGRVQRWGMEGCKGG